MNKEILMIDQDKIPEEVICHGCKKKIDILSEVVSVIRTIEYGTLQPDIYFHLDCWKNYFASQVNKTSNKQVALTFGKAMRNIFKRKK